MRTPYRFEGQFRFAIGVLLITIIIPAMGMTRRLSANTIDPVATLRDQDGRVVLTGPIRCTQTEWVELRVTITQRTTGALAEGRARFVGSILEQHWQVDANVQGDAKFEEGPATATALAVTTREGQTTDAHQWLVAVQVRRE